MADPSSKRGRRCCFEADPIVLSQCLVGRAAAAARARGSRSPAPARPARARDAGLIGTTLEPEWPYSANPSSPARSAGIERRSRCRPTPASSSTSARAAANACDLGAAIAACSALSGTCCARRGRAPADRVELDDAEGRAAPRPRLPQRTTRGSGSYVPHATVLRHSHLSGDVGCPQWIGDLRNLNRCRAGSTAARI